MPRFPDPELWEANREKRDAAKLAAAEKERELYQKQAQQRKDEDAARQELINVAAKEFGVDPSKVSVHFSCRKRMPLP